MKFKFKVDSEARKRKQIAGQALGEIRRLNAARYPFTMMLDKSMERLAGESVPQAYGRMLGLDLRQLREFAQGLIDTGLIEPNFFKSTDAVPRSANSILNYFRAWSMILVETERELRDGGGVSVQFRAPLFECEHRCQMFALQ